MRSLCQVHSCSIQRCYHYLRYTFALKRIPVSIYNGRKGRKDIAVKNLGNTGELFPQSVFIIASYGEDGTPNAMNASWDAS